MLKLKLELEFIKIVLKHLKLKIKLNKKGKEGILSRLAGIPKQQTYP